DMRHQTEDRGLHCGQPETHRFRIFRNGTSAKIMPSSKRHEDADEHAKHHQESDRLDVSNGLCHSRCSLLRARASVAVSIATSLKIQTDCIWTSTKKNEP